MIAGERWKEQLHIAHGESVGVGVDLDAAGAIEGEVFKHDVLQRADARAGVIVAPDFKVGLVVELEVADVDDVAQRDVADGAIERGAIAEALHAGQQANGVSAMFVIGRSGDVLDGEMMYGPKRDVVLPPIPSSERDGVIV